MIINKLELDLKHSRITPTVDAVQGDLFSRALELSLHSDGNPFLLPENLAVLIRYKKADGKGGEYDTLPDGNRAWTVDENRLTLIMAPQVLTFPGTVNMTVSLISSGKQLSTFPLQINVHPLAQPRTADSEDYYSVTGFLVAPANAAQGQLLKITAVDSTGRVTAVEAADPDCDGAPSDWNAGEGESGHILNRPFYSETIIATTLEETTPAFYESESSFILFDAISVTAGNEYTINWNGVAYTCIGQDISEAMEMPGGVALGDCTVLGNPTLTGNGEPFVIIAVPADMVAAMGAGVVIMPLDGSTSLTISIVGEVETIHPIPEKYLKHARAQKAFLIDLDSKTVSAPAPSSDDIDTGELQAAMTVIYEGKEHSANITHRMSESINGTTYSTVYFTIEHDPEANGIVSIILCQWEYNELFIKEKRGTLSQNNNDKSYTAFYVQRPGDTSHGWSNAKDISLDCIVLVSPSGKKFKITVDDSGNLTAADNNA